MSGNLAQRYVLLFLLLACSLAKADIYNCSKVPMPWLPWVIVLYHGDLEPEGPWGNDKVFGRPSRRPTWGRRHRP